MRYQTFNSFSQYNLQSWSNLFLSIKSLFSSLVYLGCQVERRLKQEKEADLTRLTITEVEEKSSPDSPEVGSSIIDSVSFWDGAFSSSSLI